MCRWVDAIFKIYSEWNHRSVTVINVYYIPSWLEVKIIPFLSFSIFMPNTVDIICRTGINEFRSFIVISIIFDGGSLPLITAKMMMYT